MTATKKLYILSADDNTTNQHMLKAIFQNDYDFVAVANGQECIDAIKERLPDVILMDAKMDVMGGLEACKIIRSNPQTEDLKIIMLSANASNIQAEEGLKAGANLYMTKPFVIAELKEAVKNIILKASI